MTRPAPAPFVSPRSGELDQRLQALAAEINRRAPLVGDPKFKSVCLQSPDGRWWSVTVSDAGALVVTGVVR
jgi:hypothetical protein